MTMKTHRRLLLVAAILPLLMLPSILFMPDGFPMQYSFDGSVYRFGSRYEFLLHLTLPFVVGMVMLARQRGDSDAVRRNGRFTLGLTTFLLFCYSALMLYIIVSGFMVTSWTGPLASIGVVLRVVGLCLAAVFVLYGNHMPKLAYLSWLGFHTAKTTADETAWARVHRRCGVAFVLTGAGLAVYSLLFITGSTGGRFVLVTSLAIVAACYIINWLS